MTPDHYFELERMRLIAQYILAAGFIMLMMFIVMVRG